MEFGLKQFVRAAVPIWLTERARRLAERLDPFVNLAYSQDGEDMILRRLFEDKACGFYVDVGAHHPFRFSNTCYFYRRGWSGINIDPNPEAIKAFQRDRPSDINVCVGVSDAAGELSFHFFNEPALNTFDAELAVERARLPGYRLLETRSVPVRRLEDLLTAHLPPDKQIDFLSIDVEGMDLSVLRSNDWSRFRPRFLLVEAHERTILAIERDPINRFAVAAGYRLVAKTLNTLIYEDGSCASMSSGPS
ncbi:FkbM family methyltransferase [Methylocystis sp. B8]|uniref:FkbM family methyltransferase n=1 Tax=Methylocystis sp. B8 TaxID=544938 RepID=UPI0010FED9C0|nr:FkbM family methyltransferase [Methylocystis sp. B8]TLG77619.1 FkbM family methyltransferase [Methylocystis sp. B8]